MRHSKKIGHLPDVKWHMDRFSANRMVDYIARTMHRDLIVKSEESGKLFQYIKEKVVKDGIIGRIGNQLVGSDGVACMLGVHKGLSTRIKN